ncbi:MAG: ROK family protein [Dysgonamonadaceae bacterium]|jgi:glucokinase|nr:ROK family protein [Dysgonamonadaceae bacterium]
MVERIGMKSTAGKNLIGIDIGGTKTAVIHAKENAGIELIDKTVFPTVNVRDTIENIFSHTGRMMEKHGLNAGNTHAIGISCGGPLNSRTGVVMSPPNLPGWDHIPIVKLVEERFDIPCAIQNDANACALAEWKFGAGKGTHNMIFLTFGTGLGAGLIINGKLYSGTNDNAGEVGHIRLADFGPVGYGKAGSMEGFASGGGIAQLAKMKLAEKYQMGEIVSWCAREAIETVTAQTVAVHAQQGDPLAVEIIGISAKYLGAGLAILIDILNPECIVLGSIYARNENLFYPLLEEVLKQEALPPAYRVCQIKPAELGENIGDYAAVSIAGTLDIKH